MQYLSLSINGTRIPLPTGIQHLTGGLNPTGQNIIKLGVNVLLLASLLISLIFLLIAAIKWITSEGDKQKLANARNGLYYSIIGLVISFFAFLLINIIGGFLNVNLLNP